MATKLTQAVVKALPAPATGSRITYDSETKGFGCRTTAAGVKSFVLNYRTTAGRERRYTIGRWPEWQTEAARKEAQRLKHIIDQGGDPVAEQQEERSAPTMADLCDDFVSEHLLTKRPGTAKEYKRIINSYIRPTFGQTKVAEVTHEHVRKLHRKITQSGSPYVANRTVAILSKMFSLAVVDKLRVDNPAKGTPRNSEDKRQRYLSNDELTRLTAVLAAHEDRQAADVIRLLMLTGARSGEVFAMRWHDLDLTRGVWTKLASQTKQRKLHAVPLSAPCRQLLAEIAARQKPLGEYVFPGRFGGHVTTIKKSWAIICKAAGISGLRVHDLRHSFASQLASSGVSLHVIGGLLGHSSPSTTARYAHLQDDALRQATEKVGVLISNAGVEAPAPVKLKGR